MLYKGMCILVFGSYESILGFFLRTIFFFSLRGYSSSGALGVSFLWCGFVLGRG